LFGPYWGNIGLVLSCKFLDLACGSARKLAENDQYLNLIVPFWYASAAYQASLVEPWFVFWRDVVESKYPWRDQMSLICHRGVPKKERFDIYRTQIRPKSVRRTSYVTRANLVLCGKVFTPLSPENKRSIFNCELNILCLKPVFSLTRGNITSLESDHDIEAISYQVESGYGNLSGVPSITDLSSPLQTSR